MRAILDSPNLGNLRRLDRKSDVMAALVPRDEQVVGEGADAVPELLTVEADAHLYRAKATRNAVCAGPWTAAAVGAA